MTERENVIHLHSVRRRSGEHGPRMLRERPWLDMSRTCQIEDLHVHSSLEPTMSMHDFLSVNEGIPRVVVLKLDGGIPPANGKTAGERRRPRKLWCQRGSVVNERRLFVVSPKSLHRSRRPLLLWVKRRAGYSNMIDKGCRMGELGIGQTTREPDPTWSMSDVA